LRDIYGKWVKCSATRSIMKSNGRRGGDRRASRARPLPITEGRARTMRSILAKGNRSTEVALALVLRQAGLRGWRRHRPLAGTPDFCWSSEGVLLFVDGCFWHGCPRCYTPPRHNASFWRAKITYNRQRDTAVTSQLRQEGWTVLRVWECKVGSADTLRRIRSALGR
jgi:DNA mismatch endonuclease, patch repair protein